MAESETAVILARLEGKIDLINLGLATVNNVSADHETRLRALKDRVHDIEAIPVVTPAKMWTGMATVATVAGALGPYLFTLYGR